MINNFSKKVKLIGIDEAGRGPLAGPVVVGGVKMHQGFSQAFFRGIRDSKKLSEKKREEWFVKITAHPQLSWYAAIIAPKIIDRINIQRAANLGASRVFAALAGDDQCHALLDGGLYISLPVLQETIIKGDEKIPLIAAGSIIAKVTRDRIMRKLHRKFPQYGFASHKGYATVLHRERIKKYGASLAHRSTFLRNIIVA
jgi:ribonuclease HII